MSTMIQVKTVTKNNEAHSGTTSSFAEMMASGN